MSPVAGASSLHLNQQDSASSFSSFGGSFDEHAKMENDLQSLMSQILQGRKEYEKDEQEFETLRMNSGGLSGLMEDETLRDDDDD